MLFNLLQDADIVQIFLVAGVIGKHHRYPEPALKKKRHISHKGRMMHVNNINFKFLHFFKKQTRQDIRDGSADDLHRK